MGRKIKGSHHHGAKDPEKQRQNREAKFKSKINNRPGKEDMQEIPKSMKIMMAARQNLNIYKRDRKDKGDKSVLDSARHITQEPWMPGMKKPLKPIPRFKQRDGEHKRAFYYRMHNTIQEMKSQRDYETKFKVEIQRDQTGESRVVDAEVDEVDAEAFKLKKEKLAKKGIVVRSKEEKRKLRREREKARKNKGKKGKSNKSNEEEDEPTIDFSTFNDSVEFGEVVHAPPTLQYKNKKIEAAATQSDGQAVERKPGRGDLLLKQKLGGGAAGVSKKAKKALNKPSLARQAVMEKERERVVDAYRALKAQRYAS